MTHPSASTLALYAGKDLGWFRRRRTESHLARCRECRDEVETFAAVRDDLVELNEMPAVSWNRLAAEMRANIRLGLAAGECVRDETSTAPLTWLSAPRALIACVCMVLLVAAGLFLERPAPAPVPLTASDGSVVLRATANGIELEESGEKLSLLHLRAVADEQGRPMVSYSAGAQGSMRARYVDADTGNVTINNLYVQ
jgi:hypothetical protein